ncbi:MAG: hypothetical protein BWZ02_01846 [Lentisphaerae bacterium ADurb.BinA184]|nr:MAG: hypothetical protein BWZ02_01846 [Lentisphaerae bacterium ADurb.BinA184]
MNRVHFETEHQELFLPDADLRGRLAVHVPSALGKLGYYVCLRVPEGVAAAVRGVVTSLKVGGLRPDDVRLAQGEGVTGPASYPSRSAGKVWLVLCRAYVSRGDGVLSFTGLPETLARADVLLCTWPRFVDSGQADAWLAGQADPQWAAGGIPLGGIGAGKVELCRDGRFRHYTGNNNQDMPFEEPMGLDGAFLSVARGREERCLTTTPHPGLACVPRLLADLRFPRAALTAPDAFAGSDVVVEASGPFIPHDLRRSSLPGFLVKWTLRNRTRRAVRLTCRLAWPNLVGTGGGLGTPESRTGYADGSYRLWEAPEAWRAEATETALAHVLRYTNAPSDVCAAADGVHYVAVARGVGTTGVDADPRRGGVRCTVSVPAGGSVSIPMAVVWEMPHWIDSLGTDRGMYWQNHFADGAAIVDELIGGADAILDAAAGLRNLLDATTLPEWMARRLLNCCYPLVSNSVLYRDGRFSVNEGPTEMAGCYGTLDQRLGAHPATQLLFPQLNQKELEMFAACQDSNGGVNHDFGGGHLERSASEIPWPDLTCSFILQLARHGWSTGDADFLRRHWPGARQALLRHREWAVAGGGVAQVGHGLGTSYDGYHYEGTTPYMGTLWIAALKVARRWALEMGDRETAGLAEPLIRQAVARMEADLWNGRYYRAFGSPGGPVNDNCHAGMLAGEYYARFLAGEDVLPPERLKACAAAWVELNGDARFAVPPDEVSADLAAFTEYGWLPYVECFGVAALAVLRESRALPVWERMVRAMEAGGAQPCNTRLMYQPVSGAPSWGNSYMTAPASWLVYDAWIDFAYTPATGVLRLNPPAPGRYPVVHPLFWGTVERSETGRVALTVARVFSDSPIAFRILETAGAAVTTVGGAPARRLGQAGVYERCDITPVAVREGASLGWTLG